MKIIVRLLGFLVLIPFVYYFLIVVFPAASPNGLLFGVILGCLVVSVGALVPPVSAMLRSIRTYAGGLLGAVIFSSLFAVIIILVDDARRLIASLVKHVSFADVARSEILIILAAVIGFGLFAAFILGMIFGPRIIRVRKNTVSIPALPDAFHGYRIVQFSDMHIGTFLSDTTIKKAFAKIQALNPDLIVFTGDMVNNRAEEMLPHMSVLGQLPSVIAILGNHDYGEYVSWKNPEEKHENLLLLESQIRSLGWTLLANEHTLVEKDGSSLAIAGVENWSAMARFPKYGDLKKALSGIPEHTTTVLLSHDPTHWRAEVLDHEIALTLSGHTHGMQFGIRSTQFSWSPSAWIFKEWAGSYSIDNKHLYVNVGLGMLGFPGRIGMWSEITEHTLIA